MQLRSQLHLIKYHSWIQGTKGAGRKEGILSETPSKSPQNRHLVTAAEL